MKYFQKTIENFKSKFSDGKAKIEIKQVESKKICFVSIDRCLNDCCKNHYNIYAHDNKGIEIDCFNDQKTRLIGNELIKVYGYKIKMVDWKTKESKKKNGLRLFANHIARKEISSIVGRLVLDNEQVNIK